MLALTELETDVIAELLNMGVGRAAASLGQLLNEEVTLSVPQLCVQSRQETAELMDRQSEGGIAAIKERFEGGFDGDALLLFPSHKSLELVRVMLGEAMYDGDITELEREALLEVGNIILNGCLGSIANNLGGELFCSLPEYRRGSGNEVLAAADGAEDLVLFLHIDFSLASAEIEGYVLFLLDIQAANKLRARIQEYLTRAGLV